MDSVSSSVRPLWQAPLHVFVVFVLLLFANDATAQKPVVSNTYHNEPGLPQLKIERSFVYVPGSEWMYSHHPYVAFFKGKYIAIWSNGMKDEDEPGQRMVFAVYNNFFDWSKPGVML